MTPHTRPLQEAVSGTLEELWISYNLIEKTNGIQCLKNLKVLYISNNKIKDWKEVDNLKALVSLQDLVFNGNPLMEKHVSDGGMKNTKAPCSGGSLAAHVVLDGRNSLLQPSDAQLFFRDVVSPSEHTAGE